ncbi:hypothetical protein JUNP479_2528 [Aeromonas jandaei]|uniref:hypothetical protein n=1 Tax=Aeromonas jandaei TaxID=650 RepID=UPI0019523E4B|nr:hypothetical protein [Aeromonas jandaei]BCS49798.1 hypothetical protein JUNP479_2528 [Aeromonas jandaei]
MKLTFYVLFLFLPSMAISAENKFHVYGYYNCESWSDAYNDKDVQEFDIYTGSWLAGFVSAYNYSTGRDNFRGVSISILSEYIAQYCISNPDRKVIDGLYEMQNKLNN